MATLEGPELGRPGDESCLHDLAPLSLNCFFLFSNRLMRLMIMMICPIIMLLDFREIIRFLTSFIKEETAQIQVFLNLSTENF